MRNTKIIDFRRLRPQYATPDQTATDLPLRLCAQLWPDTDIPVLDCCSCDAMVLESPDSILSMADLVYNDTRKDFSRELQTEAARIFAYNLRSEFADTPLICIIPDSTNDFELSIVRNQLNSHFSNVDFLPASIAAVFDWEHRVNPQLQNQELIIVIDAIRNGLQITPILTASDTKHKRTILERHPGITICLPDARKQLVDRLWRRRLPEILADFPGWNGLSAECGKLVFLHHGTWYELDDCDLFRRLEIDYQDLQQHISTVLRSLNHERRPILLCASDLVAISDIPDHQVCIPCNGGVEWLRQQSRTPGLPLWYDYLPELYMEVMHNEKFERFSLISKDNHRIVPVRGKTVPLSLDTLFTLPKGKKYYRFPLLRGNRGTALRFNAEIRSSVFPLAESTDCKLSLTYTYGAEEPFELSFKGNFGEARCHWKPSPLPNPDHVGEAPPKKKALSVQSLRHYNTKRNPEPIDVFDACINMLTPQFPQGIEGILKDIGVDKNGYLYCKVKVKRPGEKPYIVNCSLMNFCERLPIPYSQEQRVYISSVESHTSQEGDIWYNGLGVTFSKPLGPNDKLPKPEDIQPLVREATFDSQIQVGIQGTIVSVGEDNNGKSYCDVELDYPDNRQVRCYCYPKNDSSRYNEGDQVYVEISSKNQRKRYCRGRITKSKKTKLLINGQAYCEQATFLHKIESEPKPGDSIYCLLDDKQNIQYLSARKIQTVEFKGVKHNYRFKQTVRAGSLIWRNRTRSDDLPSSFMEEYKERIRQMLSLTHNLTLGKPKWLASMQIYLPPVADALPPKVDVRRMALDQIESLGSVDSCYNPMFVAIVLGNLSDPWQRKQFNVIRSFLSDKSPLIRSGAFSTCKNIIERQEVVATQFNQKDMECLYQCCISRIKDIPSDLLNSANNLVESKKLFKYAVDTCYALWFMLESRRSEDPNVRLFFCLYNERCYELLALLKKLYNAVVDIAGSAGADSPMRKLLFQKLNQLLYYFNGDDNANKIIVNDNEDELTDSNYEDEDDW